MFQTHPDHVANVLLAQDEFALPGEAGTPVEGAPGGTGGPGGKPGKPGEFGSMYLIFFVVVGGFILFSLLGTRRDRKKRDAMLQTIKKHDKVQTIGGVIGSIVDVNKDVVVLKVDESANTRLTFARSAIQQVLNESAGGDASEGDEKS
jgi:preprotein translocase subunit YajC